MPSGHRSETVDVRKFDYFLKVADSGSFSRAAASLHISQPVLSRQVRKLEEELGLTLFHRNGRGVTLTQGGRCLLENARAVQQALNTTMTELAAIRNQLSGNAAIGMPSSVGRVLTEPLARHFRDHLPDVRLHIVEGFSGDIMERMHHGRLDIAVTYAATNAQSIVVDPVVTEDLVLISAKGTSPGKTIALADLLVLPLVLPSASHALRADLERAARQRGTTLNVRLEVDSLASLIQLTRAGIGHTILPPAALAPSPAANGVEITTILSDLPRRTLYIASGPQRSSAVPTQQLARLVRSQMLDLAGAGTWQRIGA
jgi:LysR family nitrogen assimilation transcriptional regulator